MIKSGIEIDAGTIGTCAVVTKEVQDYSLVVGNPSEQIGCGE
jgi:acetyltransferase-like isoleucine patch superfamily enzyme